MSSELYRAVSSADAVATECAVGVWLHDMKGEIAANASRMTIMAFFMTALR